MTETRTPAMKLLVEGSSERRLIPELFKAQGISWSDAERGSGVPLIDNFGGVEKVLKAGTLAAEFKASGLKRLGVIVDANGNAAGRWDAIRQRCLSELPDIADLPEQIPEDGFVRERQDGSWFGAWIMPDNRHQGALEEFLLGLVPDDAAELVEYARRSVDGARERGAPLRDAVITKRMRR